LCVLNRQPTSANFTRTVHGKGQRAESKDPRAESKDQRSDMCTDGQPQTSSTVVLCVLADTHGRPVCGDGHTRTSCPMWAKITRTVHGKGQHAESKDQRANMCIDGQPRTSRVYCGHTRTATNVFVCWWTHGRPCVLKRQPTRTKITQTVHGKGQRAESKDQLHGKGQRAESKDQRVDMCSDGQPRTSCVC
ncbi:unnamed protein product, partial [Brassica rapa]